MKPAQHFLFGFLFCFFLYFLGFSLTALLVILVSTIAIDHYIIYGINKKKWNFLRSYKFFVTLRVPGFYFCFFHTIEFLVVLFVLAYLFDLSYLIYIFMGFSFHVVIDFMALLSKRKKFKESMILFFSCIARVLRNEKRNFRKR